MRLNFTKYTLYTKSAKFLLKLNAMMILPKMAQNDEPKFYTK